MSQSTLIDPSQNNLDNISDEVLHERIECREIVSKINDFGISQRQLIMLIGMLSLELENRELMLRILDILGEHNG